MFKKMATMLVAFSLLLGSCAAASRPPLQTIDSLVKLIELTAQTECTAFSVGKGVYLTAAHCLKDNLISTYIVRSPDVITAPRVIIVWASDDLAAFSTDTVQPGLKLGPTPRIGDEMWSFGYALDYPLPLFLNGRLQGEFAPNSNGQSMFIISRALGPGMSGGPITNSKGEVVSLNGSSNLLIGAGPTYSKFAEFYNTALKFSGKQKK